MLGAGVRRVAQQDAPALHGTTGRASLEQQLDALTLGRVSQQLLVRGVEEVVSHAA